MKSNSGFTMIEMVITVALVSIFFTAIAVAVPACLNQYISMRQTAKALEITSIVENGMSDELVCGIFTEDVDTGNIFSATEGLAYQVDNELHYFPARSLDKEKKPIALDPVVCSINAVAVDGDICTMNVIGKPLIHDRVSDILMYDEYTVSITLTYNKLGKSMTMHTEVINSEGITISTSDKPIILYQ